MSCYIHIPCEGLEHTPEVTSTPGAQSWFLIPFYGEEIGALEDVTDLRLVNYT